MYVPYESPLFKEKFPKILPPEAPKTEAPKADTPKADAPKADPAWTGKCQHFYDAECKPQPPSGLGPLGGSLS